MGTSAYTTAQMDESDRKALAPYKVSLYLPTPSTGISLTGSTENKINVTVQPPTGITPNGFDQFDLGGGLYAIRFIGSGLGNGDSGTFSLSMHMSITSTTAASIMTFKAMTRPYTESTWTNATAIPGCSTLQNLPNNDAGSLSIVAPLIALSDGDLLELSLNPSAGVTGITITDLSVTAIEIN